MALIAYLKPPCATHDLELDGALEALGLDPSALGPIDPRLRPALLRLPRDWKAAYAHETLKARATDLRRLAVWAQNTDADLLASRDKLGDLTCAALTDLSQSLGQQSFCRLASHLSAFLKALGVPDTALAHRRRMAVRSANRNARARRTDLKTSATRRWITAHDISKIRQAIHREGVPDLTRTRDSAIFSLMCELLLRRSEVGDLRLTDWDVATQCLTLRHSKTDQMGHGVSYRLSDKTTAKLEVWIAQSGLMDLEATHLRASTPIFVPLHKSGCIRRKSDGSLSSLTGASVARILKTHAAAAGIVGVCGHTPRRSVARLLKEAGIDDEKICKMGRWETVEVMRRYVGLNEVRESAGPCLIEIGL